MPTVKIVKRISSKGWPVHNRHYASAHRQADRIEKKSDPSAYADLKKIDSKISKKSLTGTHTKKGIIEVSRSALDKNKDNKISRKRLIKNIVVHESVEKRKEKR